MNKMSNVYFYYNKSIQLFIFSFFLGVVIADIMQMRKILQKKIF